MNGAYTLHQANRNRLLKALHSLKVSLKELLSVDPDSGKTLEKDKQGSHQRA